MAKRRIAVYLQTMTPDDVETGDVPNAEHDEDIDIALDAIDRKEGLTVADLAAKVLKDAGARPSSSNFHRGVWYETEWSVTDYSTGEEEQKTFHLKGFSPEEEGLVYLKVTRGKR